MRKTIRHRWDVTPESDLNRLVYFTLQKHIVYMRMDSSDRGEISLRWDDFSQFKQFLPGCPTYTKLFI